MKFDRTSGTVEQRFADGSFVRRRVDKTGRPLDYTDGFGRSERYEYDGAGRLIAQHDESGRTRSWRYDDQGRLIEENDGLGGVLRYQWTNDALSTVTDATGATTIFTPTGVAGCRRCSIRLAGFAATTTTRPAARLP